MYKILILNNSELNSKESFLQAKKYFADKKIDVSYFNKQVNELVSVHEYTRRQGFNWKTGQPALISYLGLDDIVKDNCRKYVKEGEYDCVIFMWDTNTLNHPLLGTEVITSFTNNKPLYPTTGFIQLAINQYDIDNDRLWKKITHENIHEFCQNLNRKGYKVLDQMDLTIDGKPFLENDNPYSLTGNYAYTLSGIRPYLSKLYKHPYKYFSPAEVSQFKLHTELWEILDRAREIAGVPFIITSGLRTQEENRRVGGKANSSHLRGLAVDLSCNDNFKRTAMLQGLIEVRKTTPFFLEITPRHLHIDIDLLIHDITQTILEK